MSLLKLQKNIKNIASDTLRMESRAIERLIGFLDDEFEQCVNEILSMQGRLVVTGIGKSAIIGQKMVATLNSTGTPALFMHAADAIHGDLGMIQPEDLVLCISKSGNTSEVKVLVPLLKQKGAKLIALVGNMNSYLALQADYVLNATVEREADPNDLAPTTSTTATLALGDALAVALLTSRDFGHQDFAKLHPGGSLGKQLYLKVADIYPTNALPKVQPEDSIEHVILEISGKRLGATAVVDQNDELLGIITDGDLRRMLKEGGEFKERLAKDIMTGSPKTVSEEDYAVQAFNTMTSHNITQAVVVNDQNKVLGFVHIHDLLKEGIV